MINLFSSNFFEFFPVPDLSFTGVHVPLTDSVWKGLDDSQRCLAENQNQTLVQDILKDIRVVFMLQNAP